MRIGRLTQLGSGAVSALVADKERFGSSRRARWFGR